MNDDSNHDRAHETGVPPEPSRVFSLVGHTLGKYRLVEKLGQGGMAQVYKAYQPDLERHVAVKVLHPHLTGDNEFAARFRREAQAIAALEHPHIVRIHDFDAQDGAAFLVMEHLDGTSLKEVLRALEARGETMSLSEVRRIVCALADALDYAHRRGVVHRDIKPSNVLITKSGRPVLTDFGIAHMVDATMVTGTSGILGTPAYMSPEQCQGEPGDARADLYALGVLLYQLCTGRVPYEADTPYAVILKHITAPLPLPRALRPDLPEPVERVILKALAKAPKDRYSTTGEMAAALAAALDAPPPRPAPSIRAHPRKAVLAIALAGLVLAALVLAMRPWQRPLFRGPRSEAAAPAGEGDSVVLSGPGVARDTWLDPDTPDGAWHEADLVHLQGPLTPDRLLLHFDLSQLPEGARVISATLDLRVERWGEESFPGAAVAFRVLIPWEADACDYNLPWSQPGLAAGLDYDATPLGLAPVPDDGILSLDVTHAFHFWHEQQQPNHGIVVMMAQDSHNMSHHWVYLTEQPNPADRPTLRITYEARP